MSSNFFLQDAYLYICSTIFTICFFYLYGHHPYLHVLTHSFPPRRSSDLCYATAYSVFGLACAIAGEIPNNSGSLSVFSVSAPEGCVLNALPPAPVSTRHVIGQMLPDVVFGCLRQIIPERVPAEGARSEEHTSELQSLMRTSYAVFF